MSFNPPSFCRICRAPGARSGRLCRKCKKDIQRERSEAHGDVHRKARIFTPEEVALARRMRSQFKTLTDIGNHFNISNRRAAKLVKEGV